MMKSSTRWRSGSSVFCAGHGQPRETKPYHVRAFAHVVGSYPETACPPPDGLAVARSKAFYAESLRAIHDDVAAFIQSTNNLGT